MTQDRTLDVSGRTQLVEDMRENWGKPQCKVSPVDGHGERWVDMTSLSALPAAKA